MLAEVPDGRRDDPHVAYFLQQNPGWREGDELVCLTEIDDENLTVAGRRMIRGYET
jgi:benzoyl-CoA reductase/2-hydroxyglutaryl-CoA dehydratase subunit BcrC/BadD/HgdB